MLLPEHRKLASLEDKHKETNKAGQCNRARFWWMHDVIPMQLWIYWFEDQLVIADRLFDITGAEIDRNKNPVQTLSCSDPLPMDLKECHIFSSDFTSQGHISFPRSLSNCLFFGTLGAELRFLVSRYININIERQNPGVASHHSENRD